MDYIAGGNLRQVLKSIRATGIEQMEKETGESFLAILQHWFAELVLALEYIHGLGIIHRDVKPSNIMVSLDGHMKLCDLGLGKVVSRTVKGENKLRYGMCRYAYAPANHRGCVKTTHG